MEALQAPFPWFGGKSRVASLVWERFGDVANYVEPFFGSGAVLLGRPTEPHVETVNDRDGFISNFWRAIASDPENVAHHADWPVSECDLHARHIWLVGQRETLTARLEGDPTFYDAKIAGWWVWGICGWIGSGWCSGNGPWRSVDGQLVHLGNPGRGVNRQLVHLGNPGRGVNRQLVHLGTPGQGETYGNLLAWFSALARRLRRTRITCGDWARVVTPSVTTRHGLTAVFLDPPYDVAAGRTPDVYPFDTAVSADVREWALANGDDPLMRIALCGYEGEHEMPDSWARLSWSTPGGYGSQGGGVAMDNRHRERIWFSPHCLAPATEQLSLFEGV